MPVTEQHEPVGAVPIPGVALGGGLGRRPAPAVDADAEKGASRPTGARIPRSVVRRSGKSEKMLADLATPIVRPGPTIEVQNKLVELIEATIPQMTKDRTTALQKLDEAARKFVESKPPPEEQTKHQKEYDRQFQEINQQLPAMDLQELYLGSIVLDGIPPKEKEGSIFGSKLEATDNALSRLANAFRLVERSKAEPLIVENTLATMITSGQLDYLREAGFVGKGWRIVVEIHYIRDRPASAASMHKDTLGQTLFVNLNYTNQEEMSGPEFVINPPLLAEHEQAIQENLPPEFMSDLSFVRQAVSPPTLIQTRSVPAHGVVSFVDEAIHHSTPLIGHRPIAAKKVREFLANEPPFRDLYPTALAAWVKSKHKPEAPKQSIFSSLFGSAPKQPEPPPTFAQLFVGSSVGPKEQQWWESLLAATDADAAKLERPALMKAGMSGDDVDRLLSQYGPETFTSASIPAKARKDGKGSARAPFDSKEPGRRIVLQREMSQRALVGKLPPVAVKGDQVKQGEFANKPVRRAFFRTWVRAVRIT